MSDTVKAWIEERQATLAHVLKHPHPDPAAEWAQTALDALNKVLEEHKPMPNSSSALYPAPACTCGKNYPCPTVQAIEGAINE